MWRNARHRFRVAAVVPESDTAVSVYVTGRDLDRLPARAGQFCIWRFPDHHGWWQANPFSLSAAPDGRYLRLTAKAAGTTSAGLRNPRVGRRVFVEGPYGAFTTLQQGTGGRFSSRAASASRRSAPCSRRSTGPAVVLYRVHTVADAVLLAELNALARRCGAQVHVLAGRTGSGTPPLAPVRPAPPRRDGARHRASGRFVCGPSAMTESGVGQPRALGVPRGQVHAERFSLG